MIRRMTAMKLIPLLAAACLFTACAEGGNEPRITVVSDADSKAGKPDMPVESIENIVQLDQAEIMDWVDEHTIIVAKENEALGKMSLAELADSYPRSLYLYDLDTRQYTLLKEQKNAHLGGAVLSPDKKHLIYAEYSLGDSVYNVMNMDSLDTFRLTGAPIGGAASASWADSATIVGSAYSGGAYLATLDGRMTAAGKLEEAGLYLVEKIGDTLYYNTQSDASLKALNVVTLEQKSLHLDNVTNVLPSPDGRQLLVRQVNDAKTTLLLCDLNGKIDRTIAEGTELTGISWSPDQRIVAYGLRSDANGAAVNGLYLYDMLTDKSTRIAVDFEPVTTAWSPSGERLVYAEWNEKPSRSGVIDIHFSLQR
ncbi:hypothetical protein [Paenibacillus sp. GCM10023250]|uniref:hypothetical protein n=1 Tax=Paenibacillus sp. GCM10023250 TaxID=3252648 RepID=UPI00360DFCD8